MKSTIFRGLGAAALLTFPIISGSCATTASNVTNEQSIEPQPWYRSDGGDLDVPYVPTPQPVVDRMLEIARVTEDDIIYDLGSGDGRIVITAASKYGASGIGYDLNPDRISESTENAEAAGVTDRVHFLQQDLFTVDLEPASVVTLYLLPAINLKLRPKLIGQLRPGSRIVSHAFGMGNWAPEHTEQMEVEGRVHTIYYWVVPERNE